MHVFFEPVWKLHIGEIPEKPKSKEYLKNMSEAIEKTNEWMVYVEAISAIKQNALTIQNPELIPVFPKPHINGFVIPKNFKPGEFYFWPGGYEKKEIETINKQCLGIEIVTSVVAILTLPEHVLTKESISSMKFKPEEKKNTMEREFKCMTCGNAINEGEYETFGVCDLCYEENYKKQTASGSVAAPKPDNLDLEKLFHSCPPDVQKFIFDQSKMILVARSELAAAKESLKELLPIAETELGLGRIKNPFNYDQTKAIIERARKLLSK